MQRKDSKLIELIPTSYSHVYTVQLNLPMCTRHIGQLDTAGEGTFLTNRKPKHFFRRTNSLGLNHSLLTDESIQFKWVRILYDGHSLITSRLYFLTHGRCFKFGNAGFELQCFLPLAEFGINKARAFEAEQTEQLTLWGAAV